MNKTDQASMAEKALAQLAQAVDGAQYRTPSGRVIVLDPDQHIRVLQWAAQNLRERKPKVLDSPDDLDLRPTAH